ncbi:hypothetical protein FM101_07930 [Arthrobacter rhombi]|uniref:Uncharacterized protein n=1 Tax=Arthrobacter rhombi TaxID=71253 RepID=A0A1R4G651_9MICC|nr:hypothetical protein FM101_07930 [Arthrobacter rhombi]
MCAVVRWHECLPNIFSFSSTGAGSERSRRTGQRRSTIRPSNTGVCQSHLCYREV